MTARHRSSSRSTRLPVRWPSVAGWSTGLAASAAALVGLTYLAGREPAAGRPGALDALLAAAARPAVGLPLACAALLAGASCVRFLSLHWLAWRPGRIEVATFTAGTPLADVDHDQLTRTFRRRLVGLHLQAPTPVPGAAPQGAFLDVLSSNGIDTRNPLAVLVDLVRAAKPTHAYEVHGTLLERVTRPRHGITVQVTRLPSFAGAPVTVWGETWDVALAQAADEATAAILPQTRRCRAPWGVWRGHVMPAGLMAAFEEGARLEHQRRYDEALDAYFRAVRIDPMNMALRLRIGQLQERLGLFLDALATYWGMCTSADPAGARLARRLQRRRGRRERTRALLSARYRRNVLLGGRVFAEQWRIVPDDPEHPTLRDHERRRLRQCLRPWLAAMVGHDEHAEVALLAEPDAADPPERLLELREALASFALRDCRELRAELRSPLNFDGRATLTPATVSLTELCIRTRLDWVLRARRDREVAWPPEPAALTHSIRAIEGRRGFRRWHEQYNAACVYALALLADGGDGERRAQLTELAVARLQAANARADSAFIASRRDWLLSEDPDLKALRSTREFEAFEFMYLPSALATACRPQRVHRLESFRYVRELLTATAGRWEAVWRARGEDGGAPDIPALIEWIGDERRVWEAVGDVAVNYRHSASRCALIRTMRACADRHGFEPLAVGFPRYDRAPLPGSAAGEDCDGACADAVGRAAQRMRRLARALNDPREPQAAAPLLADLERWEEGLVRVDTTRPLPRGAVARLCRDRAALWQQLTRWLAAGDAAADQTEADQTDADQTDADQTEADQTEAYKTEPARTAPAQTEAYKTEPAQTGADRSDADRADADQAESDFGALVEQAASGPPEPQPLAWRERAA